MIPHTDHAVARWMRELYRRVPVLQTLSRASVYAPAGAMAVGITRDRRWLKSMELNARLHLRRQVPDAELRARLTPDYEIFCKRIILSDRWYPALQAPNVELVSSGIAEVREHSIVDGDGVEREIDTLILATGFKPAELPIAERIRGREGSSLAEVWDGSPEAYLGTDRHGLPEPALPLRPEPEHWATARSSTCSSRRSRTRSMRCTRCGAPAPRSSTSGPRFRPPTTRSFRSVSRRRVWNTGGCGSWYFDRNGRNSIQWPGFTFEYRRRTRRFDAEAYRLAAAA